MFSGFENLNPGKDMPPQSDLYYYVLSDIIPAFILAGARWGKLTNKS
jgi:hypothetical protein